MKTFKTRVYGNSYLLQVQLNPYQQGNVNTLINWGKQSADERARQECSKCKCKTASLIPEPHEPLATASGTWIYTYQCYDCKVCIKQPELPGEATTNPYNSLSFPPNNGMEELISDTKTSTDN